MYGPFRQISCCVDVIFGCSKKRLRINIGSNDIGGMYDLLGSLSNRLRALCGIMRGYRAHTVLKDHIVTDPSEQFAHKMEDELTSKDEGCH